MVGADIGLVLVVGRDDLDLEAALLDAGILDRHLRGGDRARAGEVGVEARHVGQHADLDDVVGDLRLRARDAASAGRDGDADESCACMRSC